MYPEHEHKDVIIIGAGASGLFCAAACGRRGRSVLVLDHARRAAAKVLISGGGRCNFTNLNAAAEHYRSRNPHFSRSALARFTPRDLLALIEQNRIPYEEKEAGQLFCARSARDIAGLLERECARSGAEVLLGCRVERIERSGGFVLTTDRGVFRSRSLVIATGGLSYANLGATGFGLDVARQFGLAVVEPRPALVPFVLAARDQKVFGPLAGVSLEVAAACGGRTARGGMLFTHRGLSGPALLQASLSWEPGMPVVIDLLPDTDLAAAFAARRQSKVGMQNLLARFLPRRLAEAWCRTRGLAKPVNQTPDRELKEIARGLHAWEVVPKGTEGYATAEVTAGGVDTNELSSRTLEAAKVPGLYFIGEVVDVTGELGGFNLHWAWASARAAGESA